MADEVCYIQRRAAQDDSRIVSIGPLLLFSTETGDAWMLDPADQLATPIARQREALSVHIEDTDTKIYEFTTTLPAEEKYNLASQLRRSAASVPLNIAEGSASSTNTEFSRFLSYGYRSLKEMITGLVRLDCSGGGPNSQLMTHNSKLQGLRPAACLRFGQDFKGGALG